MKYSIIYENKSGIYKITNTINNKIYIGSAYVLYKRFKEHRWALIKKRHHNIQLSRFVEKYNINVLCFELIEYVEISMLEEREQYHINKNKMILFNESLDVKSWNRNKKLTEEHKQNISKSLKQHKQTPEHRLNINKSLKGKAGKYIRTEELKSKMSNIISSNEERKSNISKALKGRKVDWVSHSEETKIKIGEKNKKNNLKPILQFDLEGNFIKEWNSIIEAAIFINPHNTKSIRCAISDCLREKTKKSNGYKWKYKQ
jgi:group I intron endonuclease